MKLTIRTKIIVIAVAILLIALGTNTLTSSYLFTKEYSSALQSQVSVIAHSLRYQLDRLLRLGTPIGELIGFENQCQEVVDTYPKIAYAAVVDLNNTILFHNDPSQHGKTFSDDTVITDDGNETASSRQVLRQEEQYYEIAVPVLGASNQQVAFVKVGFPLRLITRKTGQLVISSVGVGLLSFGAAVIVLIATLSVWVTATLTGFQTLSGLFSKENIMNTSLVLKNMTKVLLILLSLWGAWTPIQVCADQHQTTWQDELKFEHAFDLGSPGGQTMLQDRDGFLWIGTEGSGVFRWDGYELKNYGTGPGLLSNGTIWRIIEDRQDPNIFWIATSGGLNRFNKATETCTVYRSDPNTPKGLGDNTIHDVIQDRNTPEVLWIGTGSNGLNKLHTHSGEVTRYEPDPNEKNSIAWHEVWRLIEDPHDPNILWLATFGGGLDKFDKRTEIFTHYTHNPDDPGSLNSENGIIGYIEQDKDDPDILWVGTNNGLDKLQKSSGTFTHYTHDPQNPQSIMDGIISLNYDDGHGRLWLGGYVENNGLTIFDKAAGTFRHYTHVSDDPWSLSSDLIVNVFEDRSGIFWITSYSGTVDKVDVSSQNFTRYHRNPVNPDSPKSLSNNVVNVIYEDRQDTVWIGTQKGLNRFDRETESFTRYTHNPDDPESLDVDYILEIHEDASGTFWISFWRGPLLAFDRETGKVLQRYDTVGEIDSYTIIVEDPRNPDLLWLGTRNGGLARFSKADETFTFFRPNPGHPEQGPLNGYVYEAIHDREEEAVWLGGWNGGG